MSGPCYSATARHLIAEQRLPDTRPPRRASGVGSLYRTGGCVDRPAHGGDVLPGTVSASGTACGQQEPGTGTGQAFSAVMTIVVATMGGAFAFMPFGQASVSAYQGAQRVWRMVNIRQRSVIIGYRRRQSGYGHRQSGRCTGRTQEPWLQAQETIVRRLRRSRTRHERHASLHVDALWQGGGADLHRRMEAERLHVHVCRGTVREREVRAFIADT